MKQTTPDHMDAQRSAEDQTMERSWILRQCVCVFDPLHGFSGDPGEELELDAYLSQRWPPTGG